MSTIANQAMLDACLTADQIYARLTKARACGYEHLSAYLEKKYDAAVDKVNAMWDAWNESLLQERLARLRA